MRPLAERLWTRAAGTTPRWPTPARRPDSGEAEYISNFAKVVLEGGGDDKEAVTALVAAARRKPEAARSLARQLVLTGEPFRANEKRGGGKLPAARFWFSLASQVDPTYDRPEVELRLDPLLSRPVCRGRDHFQEAQRRDPRNASTLQQLGETYLKLGDRRGVWVLRAGRGAASERAEAPEPRAAYLVAGRQVTKRA